MTRTVWSLTVIATTPLPVLATASGAYGLLASRCERGPGPTGPMRDSTGADSRYDSHGCYSGSGVKVPGGFEFFYTGNVKNEKGNRETYQILATVGDAKPTRQLPPLISGPEKGNTAHYRDPHVFERNGEWWMVIGAQRGSTGAVVVYTSADRRERDLPR